MTETAARSLVKVSYDFGAHDQEGRTITAHFKTFVLVCTYVPNSGVLDLNRLQYRTQEWDRDLQKHLTHLERSTGKPVIWCGDLNVAHRSIDVFAATDTTAGFTPEERNSFDRFLCDNNFVDTFRHLHPTKVKYSCWDLRFNSRAKDEGWRLDYFVCSQSLMDRILDSNINSEHLGSDHCPISLDLKL
jgi:exodeoxyribonuclease III